MGFKLQNPDCACCGGPSVENCTDFYACFNARLVGGNRLIDYDIEVTISGVANGNGACTNCTVFNNTFLWQLRDEAINGFFGGCGFGQTGGGDPAIDCGGGGEILGIVWGIDVSGVDVEIRTNTLGTWATTFQYVGNIGSLCGGGSIGVPLSVANAGSDPTFCDGSGASCTITATPA